MCLSYPQKDITTTNDFFSFQSAKVTPHSEAVKGFASSDLKKS